MGVYQTGYYQTSNAVWAVSGFTFNAIPATFSPEQLGAIRGSFGIACLAAGQLHVARDPAGCQSLYDGRVGTRWLLATEPKAITAEVAFQRRIRPASIAQYLAFSFVPGGGTMLEELYEVKAGHVVTLDHAAMPQVQRMFCSEQEEWDSRGEKQSIAADIPPVSAGEWIQGTRRCIEQAVAERIGSRHQEVLIRPKQFLPRLRQMIWHLDEPSGPDVGCSGE